MMSESQVTSETKSTPPPQPAQTVINMKSGSPQPASDDGLKLNVDYFRTLPGAVKIVEIIIGVICMGCGSPAMEGTNHWFLFVVVACFIGTLLWSFIHLLSIKAALKLPINWTLSELLYTLGAVILYFIAFIVELTSFSAYAFGRYVAAGIFGIFNTVMYLTGAVLLFKEWKASRAPPQ